MENKKEYNISELAATADSREAVIERFNNGEKMEFVCFWGHATEAETIGTECFSQWFPCQFVEDGVNYHTAEQYMMAKKALLFKDQSIYERIMAADNPEEYKALGREVHGFNPDIWDAHKFEIVLQGNIAKFSQNQAFKDFLLSTEEKILVEASLDDAIWGVKLPLDDPKINNPNDWKGQNLLGFALMITRNLMADSRRSEFA